MKLRISRPALLEALERRDPNFDIDKVSHQEMRSLVLHKNATSNTIFAARAIPDFSTKEKAQALVKLFAAGHPPKLLSESGKPVAEEGNAAMK